MFLPMKTALKGSVMGNFQSLSTIFASLRTNGRVTW